MINSKKASPEFNRRVFVAMSGGVDSSVAAHLLKEQGYNVTGIFMHCYNLDGCSERDAEDARRVAEYLQIPFYIFDFEEDYKRKVVEYMVEGYKNGLTPNPDVMCNKEIKFGLFLERALFLGADYIATGHYVRKISDSLYAAKDNNKDQSYFLWTLTQNQIERCLFPIGDHLKSEVREIARKAGLSTADKKDSQGICFLGKVTLRDFLESYIPKKTGPVFTTEGKKIGEHIGGQFYTIGQRHIGVSYHEQVYVAEKNIKTNTVTVAEGSENSALFKKEIELRNLNFINPINDSPIRANCSIEVLARVRYRQPLSKAELRENRLVFKNPQKFVAPGQSVVFYSKVNPSSLSARSGRNSDGSEFRMLGGGVIA